MKRSGWLWFSIGLIWLVSALWLGWRNAVQFVFFFALGVLAVKLWVSQKKEIIQKAGSDPILAARIIQPERLKLAEARLDLKAREGVHMCLAVGCRQSIVGKWIFAHCQDHLVTCEQQWQKEIESLGSEEKFLDREGSPVDASQHPFLKAADEIGKERTQELIKEHVAFGNLVWPTLAV